MYIPTVYRYHPPDQTHGRSPSSFPLEHAGVGSVGSQTLVAHQGALGRSAAQADDVLGCQTAFSTTAEPEHRQTLSCLVLSSCVS